MHVTPHVGKKRAINLAKWQEDLRNSRSFANDRCRDMPKQRLTGKSFDNVSNNLKYLPPMVSVLYKPYQIMRVIEFY
jgi:hypothetical protein